MAPFLLALPCFALCFVIVCFAWEENYGDQNVQLIQAYREGFGLIWRDRKIMFLGMVQSIVESCMYIFVFLWTPVLTDGMLYFSCKIFIPALAES